MCPVSMLSCSPSTIYANVSTVGSHDRAIAQAEAKALKDQVESASATPSDHPQANGSAPDESVAAAAAAAQAAAEEEAKSLKEELRGVRGALEASEESRKSVEGLLAETKQVRGFAPRPDGDSLLLLLSGGGGDGGHSRG